MVPSTGLRLVMLSAKMPLPELVSYDGERYISGMYSKPGLFGSLVEHDAMNKVPRQHAAKYMIFFFIFLFERLLSQCLLLRHRSLSSWKRYGPHRPLLPLPASQIYHRWCGDRGSWDSLPAISSCGGRT